MRIPFTFLFLLQVSFCYHFTCDQLVNELIPMDVQIDTTYACVVFQLPLETLYFDYYQTVLLRDLGTGYLHSLAQVYTTCNYCIEGKGPWEVVRESSSDPISCRDEVVLLFTSQPTVVVPSNQDGRECTVPAYPLKTIVAPNSGAIQTDFRPPYDSEINVYLGVGKDESEEMYLISRPKTYPSGFTMTMFDWVISVSNNYDYMDVETPSPEGSTLISFDFPRPFLGSSAMLGNAHFKEIHTAKTFAIREDDNPVIRVTGSVYYNSSNVVSIYQNDVEFDLPTGPVDITMVGDFDVRYNTHPDKYVNQRLNETFELFFELLGHTPSTKLPVEAPTTVPTRTPTRIPTTTPTTTPTRSPSKTPTIPTSTTTVPPTEEPVVNEDSYCTCDVDENGIAKSWASQLWLDIVILVDTSLTMGFDGADEISSLIESLVGKMNLDSNGPSPMYSRVGLISLSNTAEVIYNLNMTSDSDVNLKESDQLSVDIAAGFQVAMKMFQDGKNMPNYRESAKEIIYFITNSAPQGVLNGVFEFKSSGGIVIVANYVREGQVPLEGLKTVASPNYFFTNLTDDYTYNLQVFCDANCFCPPDKIAFTDGSVNPRQDANRGCYNVATLGIPYKNALKTCSKEGAVMTSIHDDDKQFFLNSIVSNIGPKTKYWIGYQNDGNTWKWIDNSTDPYSNWDVSNGQPNTNGGQNLCTYAVQTTGFNTEWYAANCDGGFFFVCEKAPCAAGRYCTFEH